MTLIASFWCLCLLQTYFTTCSSVSFLNFEHKHEMGQESYVKLKEYFQLQDLFKKLLQVYS